MRISTLDDTHHFPQLETLLSRAYQQLGYKVQFVFLPGQRALTEAEKGQGIDAEALRIDLGEEPINLIKVPEPLFQLHVSAFVTRTPSEQITWKKLAYFRVSSVRGFKIVERNVSHHKLIYVANIAQAFQLLAKDRVDVVIAPKKVGQGLLKTLGLNQIYPLTPALQVLPVYHYIHAKHAHLLPELTMTLKALKSP